VHVQKRRTLQPYAQQHCSRASLSAFMQTAHFVRAYALHTRLATLLLLLPPLQLALTLTEVAPAVSMPVPVLAVDSGDVKLTVRGHGGGLSHQVGTHQV